MSEGLLQVEIPDFGGSVLVSLNQQRLRGQYCDVSVLVQGQAFKAHRAQILSFCYTGRLSMAASEQLVLMYTAGYLQIQNIVERGMELMMMKASSSPLCCDSQTTSTDELGGFDAPPLQEDQQGLSPEELILAVRETPRDLHPTRSSALCYLGAAAGGLVPGLQSYLLASGGRCSPGGSSLPTDSPPSHPPTEEDLEEDYYGNTVNSGLYQHVYGHPGNPYIQEKVEMLSLPLANERRPCVLVGRDNMALPASLISQIGFRCHPSLYTEGDPGEKVELVAVYCQNFAPHFKESEMNVIAADMCTNARRVRKRWLPKIQSLLPDSLPPNPLPRRARRGGGPGGERGEGVSMELDLRQLSYLEGGEREAPHLQFAGSGGGGERLQTEPPPDLPLSSSSCSSSSSHPSPQPAESAPPHRGLADTEERGAEPLEDSQ
ncbi:Nucleus accumbens-associated protein 2 [Dissostichus eleginoides]|uniref:Nucleus accumbens-associated protein 2 n=1 Tax=Dissostichus eleginoides TaxID=100907 RepID=A0AAD9B2G6_DISEL|nr:Nucleus accumbens-associated protein 2 [Dissostichus eleginoides]